MTKVDIKTDVKFDDKTKLYVINTVSRQELTKEEMINYINAREKMTSAIKSNIANLSAITPEDITAEVEAKREEILSSIATIPASQKTLNEKQKELDELYEVVKDDKEITTWMKKFEELSKEFKEKQGEIKETLDHYKQEFTEKLELGKKL